MLKHNGLGFIVVLVHWTDLSVGNIAWLTCLCYNILMVGLNHHLPFHGKVICCPRVSMGNRVDIVEFSGFPKTVPDQSFLCLVMEDAESQTGLLDVKLDETRVMYGVIFGPFLHFYLKRYIRGETGEEEIMRASPKIIL